MADAHLKLAREVTDAHSDLEGTERAIANSERTLESLRARLPQAEQRYAAAVKALSGYYAQPTPELPKKIKTEDTTKKMMM